MSSCLSWIRRNCNLDHVHYWKKKRFESLKQLKTFDVLVIPPSAQQKTKMLAKSLLSSIKRFSIDSLLLLVYYITSYIQWLMV